MKDLDSIYFVGSHSFTKLGNWKCELPFIDPFLLFKLPRVRRPSNSLYLSVSRQSDRPLCDSDEQHYGVEQTDGNDVSVSTIAKSVAI